jgi:hypothetical protein
LESYPTATPFFKVSSTSAKTQGYLLHCTKCLQKNELQEDFRAGLDELLRGSNSDGESAAVDADRQLELIPDDFQMDVFCINSNDYLKIKGIKPGSDGPLNTFSNVNDTQIPALRAFVHDATAKRIRSYAVSYVDYVGNILDRVRLLSANAKDVPASLESRQLQAAFEKEKVVRQKSPINCARLSEESQ